MRLFNKRLRTEVNELRDSNIESIYALYERIEKLERIIKHSIEGKITCFSRVEYKQFKETWVRYEYPPYPVDVTYLYANGTEYKVENMFLKNPIISWMGNNKIHVVEKINNYESIKYIVDLNTCKFMKL